MPRSSSAASSASSAAEQVAGKLPAPTTSAEKGGAKSPQLAGYTGTYASDPKLTPARVATWAPAELRIKRNEIYARYGRAFKSADLREHFGAQSWYRVSESYSDELLTANDKANVALIKSFEGTAPARDGQYGQLMFMNDRELVISDGDSMYGHEGEERYYEARGATYVITWSGAPRLDLTNPAVDQAELWTWRSGSWTRAPLPQKG